jgi:hypothetical protein
MVDLAIQRLRGTDWDVSGILKTGQPQVGRMVDGIPGNVLDVVHWTLREQGKEFEEDVATVIHHWSTGELHILSLRDGRLDTNPPVRVPNLAAILGPRPTAPDLLAADYGGHRNLKSLRNSRKVEVRLVRDDSENERKIQVTPWRTLNPEQRARMVQFLVNPDHFELFPEGSRFCTFRVNARIRMQTDQGTMVFEACFGCDELRLHRPGKLENILWFEAGQHVLYALLAEVFPLHPELGPAPDPAGIPDQETNRRRTEAALDRFWGRWQVSR